MTDYREQLDRLTQRQREALAANLDQDRPRGQRRLIAYFSGSAKASDLRNRLANCLPSHALPEDIVSLPELPKTPNGKIDREALGRLPDRPSTTKTTTTIPLSELEQRLIAIWKEVLQVDTVGPHDDFYQLGGDSILSIQVVSKATQAGLEISMKQFVANRTIAELAAELESSRNIESGAIAPTETFGPIPLTPIQHWFFDHKLGRPQQWNQEVLIELPPGINVADLKKAFSRLGARHQCLRSAFTKVDGNWTCQILEKAPEDILSECDGIEEASKQHACLDLATGALLKASYLRPNHQLFIAAHHLIVDHVSWSLLLEDLNALLLEHSIPTATTTFTNWANYLTKSSQTGVWESEIPFWQRMLTGRGDLPLDVKDPPPSAKEKDSQIHVQVLSPDQTQRLLQKTKTHEHETSDFLITALVQALNEWAGEDCNWRIGIEHHGRHTWKDAPDVSRTAGWMTAYHQITFEGTEFDAVRRRLREVQNHGIGFGILKYLSRSPELNETADSQILFNYLGRNGQHTSLPSLPVDTGQARGGENERSHLLEINASIEDNCLHLHWHYSPKHHCRSTIEELTTIFSERITALSDHTIAAAFPLTANQNALLWHHLQNPENDAGRLRVSFMLEGELDLKRFEQAWNQVILRHPALRTTIRWAPEDTPTQTVHEEASLQLETSLPSDATLPLDRTPTMRVGVGEISKTRHRVHWLCHHLFLDGWSASLVCQELITAYSDPDQAWSPAPSFEAYANALSQADTSNSKAYWQENLLGANSIDAFVVSEETSRLNETSLPQDITKHLTEAADKLNVTIATLVQVAWGIVMARIRETQDIVIGNVVSGRTLPLADIQHLVGLCANVSPLRLKWAPEDSIKNLIIGTHEDRLNSQPYEHTSLDQIQEWIDLAPTKSLFESLLMVANYPQSDLANTPLRITDFEGPVTSVYPITLAVNLGDQLALKLFYRSEWAARVSWLHDSMHGVLTLLAQEEDPQSIRSITAKLPEPPPLASTLALIPQEKPTNDRVEDFIASIWKDVFQIEEIGNQSSFRELGGTSLLAAKLTGSIGEAFNTRLPLDFVFKAPTISAMAAAIHDENSSLTWPIVVPIRREGSKPPLFLIHGLGGGIYNYFDWAEHLSEDLPLFALQAPIEPLKTLEAIAKAYLSELRKVQKHGPYHIAGFCFGAAVGFEIVRQLEDQGETVAYFGVIDGMLPSLQPSRTRYAAHLLWNSSANEITTKIKGTLKRLGARACRLLSRSTASHKLEMADVIDADPYPEAYRSIAQIHFRAARDYLPCGRIQASIHLIHSQSDLAEIDPHLGWDKIASNVKCDVIPCLHSEIVYKAFLPNVTEALQRELDALIVNELRLNRAIL